MTRVNGVKAAQHRGTPRLYHNILILVERDTTVERILTRNLDLATGREGVGGR